MESYTDFKDLSAYVLEEVFFENGIKLNEDVKSEILGKFKELPAYNDVVASLKFLKENDILTIAVSNSSESMMKKQLENAKIIDFFDSYYSVDIVKRYKPFPEIYQYVANEIKLKPCEICMVATHDWDLFGAGKVGLKTAYISRKETIYCPYYEQADYQGNDLFKLVNDIVNGNAIKD